MPKDLVDAKVSAAKSETEQAMVILKQVVETHREEQHAEKNRYESNLQAAYDAMKSNKLDASAKVRAV